MAPSVMINGVFGGRDIHPVEFYLEAWWTLAAQLTGLLVAGVLVLAWWVLKPEARKTVIDRALGGRDGLAPGDVLRLALAAGLLGGLAEALYLGVRQALTTHPAGEFHPEVFWMAPLSAGLAALQMGCLIGAISLGGRRRMAVSYAMFVFGFPAIYGVVQSEGIPLHWLAEVILALGLTSVVARAAVARQPQVLAVLRRATPAFAVALCGIVVTAWVMHPASMERRALRSTPLADAGLPNLVIIILDTARAANFSLYGYERRTSPELDDWAREGTVFERAIAASSWTLPSHANAFTGEHNHVMGTSPRQPLADEFSTLAEVLQTRGYKTGGFVANPLYTTAMSGLDQGFARYDDRPWDVPHFLWSSWLSARLLGRPLSSLDPGFEPGYKTAETVTEEFLAWVDERDDERPFFAFLNYFEVHAPYFAPDPWAALFGPVPSADRWWSYQSSFRPDSTAVVDQEELDRWINRYDGGIAYLDHHVGRIRSWLEESGLSDNTIVVVTADHGEMWGEHGMLKHAGSLYLPVLHVPLFVTYRGRVPGGVRVEQTVSLGDLPRTIGDLTGIDDLTPFPGASLAPHWSGGRGPHHRYVLAELEPHGGIDWWAPINHGSMKSLLSGRFQYILNGNGDEELYDIVEDYEQTTNLAGEPELNPEIVRFRAALDSILREAGQSGS